MTLEQAGAILRKAYDQAQPNQKVVQIHLFGIRYAKQIDGISKKGIAIAAGLPDSYGTEIAKGSRLADFVAVIE